MMFPPGLNFRAINPHLFDFVGKSPETMIINYSIIFRLKSHLLKFLDHLKNITEYETYSDMYRLSFVNNIEILRLDLIPETLRKSLVESYIPPEHDLRIYGLIYLELIPFGKFKIKITLADYQVIRYFVPPIDMINIFLHINGNNSYDVNRR